MHGGVTGKAGDSLPMSIRRRSRSRKASQTLGGEAVLGKLRKLFYYTGNVQPKRPFAKAALCVTCLSKSHMIANSASRNNNLNHRSNTQIRVAPAHSMVLVN